MSDAIEVTPETDAAPAQPEFTDSAQSVDALLAAAAAPTASNPKATAVRLFAFRPEGATERLALVFVGPEAEVISRLFVDYAAGLFDAIERRQQEAAGDSN